MKVVRISECGGPEAMHVDELPTPEPGRGELLVEIAAAGVNFLDVYHRTGVYKLPLPLALGREAAGVVEKVGPEVTGVAVGDHVAWSDVSGSYATHAKVPAARAVPVPAKVDLRTAAAAMLQGLTAHYLALSTVALRPGDDCIVHAGAGGVGLLLTQIAKKRGARVLTTVSTEDKAKLSRGAGADEVVLYTKEDFVAAAKKMTGGKGVRVVYDSVGKTTFDDSMKAVEPRGFLVLFGASSGAVPPVDPQRLAGAGSIFLTRPTLANYSAGREELLERSRDLFGWIERGELDVRIGATFPLADAAEAHRALEGRRTTGKVLLIP
jgi:NADPH2:quinone reductase